MKLIDGLLEPVFVWFFFQISRFTEIVLDRDSNKEYRFYYDEEDPACPTLLHLAVGWNFLHVAKLLVERYPSLIYTETQQVEEEREYLPVEKALMLYNDETAAYLISQMKPDRWVTKLYYIYWGNKFRLLQLSMHVTSNPVSFLF